MLSSSWVSGLKDTHNSSLNKEFGHNSWREMGTKNWTKMNLLIIHASSACVQICYHIEFIVKAMNLAVLMH